MLEEILSKSNMQAAYERVVGNKGAAGVDGIEAGDFLLQLQRDWPAVREQLENSSYKPGPVKLVTIPKPHGGERHLGIPTYMDRLIQQAIAQVLTKEYEPGFSFNSYGFRSEKNAQQAVLKAKEYINAGYSHVVDLDLSQFFDRVNHDYLMNELSRRIMDKRVLKLIHKILRAEIADGKTLVSSRQGVPQGGPLSPLLSNVILDKLDKELESRGHRYVRYADDCSIYVKSKRSGDCVMESITSKPYAMSYRIVQLNKLNIGWGHYFKLSEAKSVFDELDKWVRSCLRLCYWSQWKRPRTRVKELMKLGLPKEQSWQWGNTRKGPWRIVHSPILGRALSNNYFKEEGFTSLMNIVKPR